MENVEDKEKIEYADDNYESVKTLFKIRAPALFLGLILGFGISFVTSHFEEVLSSNIEIAFFLPFVVYIADAIGAQTQSIYASNLKLGRAKFSKYLHKELSLGIIFGLMFSLVSGIVSFFWFGDKFLTLSVGLGTFGAIIFSPVLAIILTHAFQLLHKDPAATSGPIITVVQDMASVVIYGIICSLILLK
jgi:magnesium transporter